MTSCSPVGGYYTVKDPKNYKHVWLVNFTTSEDVKSMFQCFTWLSLDGIVQSDWLYNKSECTIPYYHFCHWVNNYVSNDKNETIKYDWCPALQKGYCSSDQYQDRISSGLCCPPLSDLNPCSNIHLWSKRICMLITVTLKSEREHSEDNNVIYDMIFTNCNWVSTLWQWLVHLYTNRK